MNQYLSPALPGLGNEITRMQPRGSSAVPHSASEQCPVIPVLRGIKLVLVAAAFAVPWPQGAGSAITGDAGGIRVLPRVAPSGRFLSQTHIMTHIITTLDTLLRSLFYTFPWLSQGDPRTQKG